MDYIVNGPGDTAFPALLNSIKDRRDPESIKTWFLKATAKLLRRPKKICQTSISSTTTLWKTQCILPAKEISRQYRMLGTKTASYHSSFGCPFTCSFCAVVPIYNARWKGKSAQGIYNDLMRLKIITAKCRRIPRQQFLYPKTHSWIRPSYKKKNMAWWGEARIDTMDKLPRWIASTV